jgi:hypothetical protein
MNRQFNQVGELVLNPNYISDVILHFSSKEWHDAVRVYMGVTTGAAESAQEYHTFEGDEAAALRHYFSGNSRDLVAEMKADEQSTMQMLDEVVA